APVPADPTTLGGLTISITLPGPGGPQVLGPSAPLPAITGLGDIAPALQGALQDLLGIVPVKVSLIANGSSQPMIRILLPDPTMANLVPTYGGTITTKLAFVSNVQAYQLGATGGLVVAAAAGSDPTYLKAGAGAASLVPALPGQVIVDQTSLIGDRAKRTGLYALDSVDLFNMLSLPDLRTFGLSGLGAYKTVAATAAAYCEAKRGFLILDLPIGVGDLDGARAFMAQAPGFASTNAAAYFPELIISDPANAGADRAVGVSGVMAGLYARTDASRGIWKAPAGVDAKLKNVTRLAYTLSDEEVGVLNPLGLNALRVQTVYGLVCWGARTLMGSDQLMSEWKYVPVRRLALFLEESLKRGLQWTVFEPNDEVLWAQIRLEVGSFLQNLFIQGAFAGRSPAEAFFVACDPSTTSIDEIAGGVVNVQIGFAPLRPAEFVFLNVRQIAGQTKG
ncbi:MAG TPA: phage tail sheath C-terminal domain-containing protein, partial [Caulobacter sp.]|nr:phage tail sheath C-terminal domain-containing protein [Caulobacter sp.]